MKFIELRTTIMFILINALMGGGGGHSKKVLIEIFCKV